MPTRPPPRAVVAVARLPTQAWKGNVWRSHRKVYPATDWTGSLKVSARYHRAVDHFPLEETWPALYLGISYGVCMAETIRHLPNDAPLSMLQNFYLSEIEVSLRTVVDCRNLTAMGFPVADVLRDHDYSAGQELAALIRTMGCDGFLISSATLLPDAALIVFPDKIQPGALTVIRSIAPNTAGTRD